MSASSLPPYHRMRQLRYGLQGLGVPVFHPVILYRSKKEWEASLDGMGNLGSAGRSSCKMYGMIEMLPVATAMKEEPDGSDHDWHHPIASRWEKIERGSGPGSGCRMCRTIKEGCDCPERLLAPRLRQTWGPQPTWMPWRARSGSCGHRDRGLRGHLPGQWGGPGQDHPRELEQSASSGGRRSKVVVERGGCLCRVDEDTYGNGSVNSPDLERMVLTWGEPPGEGGRRSPSRDALPGRHGHLRVAMGQRSDLQPKQGCAGSRCDGRVCRILHDPGTPPPHHFPRDLQCSNGYSGQMSSSTSELTGPSNSSGKSAALSASCLPDAVLGSTAPAILSKNCVSKEYFKANFPFRHRI